MASGYGLRGAESAASQFAGRGLDDLADAEAWAVVLPLVERCWGLSERVDHGWLDLAGSGADSAFRWFCVALGEADPGVVPVRELEALREIVYGLEIGEGPTGVVTLVVYLTGAVEEGLDARQLFWVAAGQLLAQLLVGYWYHYGVSRTDPASGGLTLNDLEHEWRAPDFYGPFLDAIVALVKSFLLDLGAVGESAERDSDFLAELLDLMATVDFPSTGPLADPPWASVQPELAELFLRAGWASE